MTRKQTRIEITERSIVSEDGRIRWVCNWAARYQHTAARGHVDSARGFGDQEARKAARSAAERWIKGQTERARDGVQVIDDICDGKY